MGRCEVKALRCTACITVQRGGADVELVAHGTFPESSLPVVVSGPWTVSEMAKDVSVGDVTLDIPDGVALWQDDFTVDEYLDVCERLAHSVLDSLRSDR